MGLLSTISDIFDPNNHFIPKERDPSKYPGATPEDRELLQTSQQMRSQAGAFQPLVRQRLAELADPSKQQAMARDRAGADVAQQLRGAGTPFQRAMARGKALSRVALQGDAAVQMQSLRDRVGMARLGSGMLTGTARDLAGMSENSAEIAASKMRASQIAEAGAANFTGSMLGGIGRMWEGGGRRGSSGAVLRPQTMTNGIE